MTHRSPDLLHGLLVSVPGQGGKLRQPLICEALVGGDNHPMLGGALHVRRQLGFSGPRHRTIGELQPWQLVRDLVGHEGLDDDGAVDEDRVGHVQRGWHHAIILELQNISLILIFNEILTETPVYCKYFLIYYLNPFSTK